MMKEWDEMGVWKTDVLNNTSSDNREDFKLGKTAAEQHHTETWTDLVSKTPENVPVLRWILLVWRGRKECYRFEYYSRCNGSFLWF